MLEMQLFQAGVKGLEILIRRLSFGAAVGRAGGRQPSQGKT